MQTPRSIRGKRRLLLLVPSVLALLLFPMRHAPAAGPDAPRRIVLSESLDDPSGTYGLSTDAAYAGVVRITWFDGTKHFSHGTGSLVSERWVLTAAHLFDNADYTDVETDPSPYRIHVGATVYEVETIVVYSGYVPETAANDIALMKLATAVPSPTTYRYNTGEIAEAGAAGAILAGYGATGSAQHGIAEGPAEDVLRVGTNRVDLLGDGTTVISMLDGTSQLSAPGTLVVDFDNHTTPTVNGSLVPGGGTSDPKEATTAPGDSGGPLFLRGPDGTLWVCGITSFGLDSLSRWGDVAVYTRVADYHSFVTETIGATPAPTVSTAIATDKAAYTPGETMTLTVSVAAADISGASTDVFLYITPPGGAPLPYMAYPGVPASDIGPLALPPLVVPPGLASGSYTWTLICSAPADPATVYATDTAIFTYTDK